MYVHTLYSVVAVLRLCKVSRQSSCTIDYRIFSASSIARASKDLNCIVVVVVVFSRIPQKSPCKPFNRYCQRKRPYPG